MFYFSQAVRSLKRRVCLVLIVVLANLTGAVPCCLSTEAISVDRHLVQYDTGIVFDTHSNLEWYAGPDRKMRWSDAKNWVAGLDLQGGRWRMPTPKELDTLYHVGDGVQNITRLLKNSGYWIWSGSTIGTAAKWIFRFSYGGEGWNGQAPEDGGRAIAVRHRQTN
jgi:hypothetical protein